MELNINLQNFPTILNLCVELLQQNLKSYDPFDPQKPYKAKNKYADDVNSVGIKYLHPDYLNLAEMFFQKMLDITFLHERTTGEYHHRGYFFGNLGVVQIRLGKFDEGIAYLLEAEKEDRKHPEVAKDWKITKSILWTQFAKIIRSYSVQLMQNYAKNLQITIDGDAINSCFEKMETIQTLILETSILGIMKNKEIYTRFPNAYTVGRLYLHLKDVCLLVEHLLRQRQINNGVINETQSILLGKLLQKVKFKPFEKPPLSKISTSANNLGDFLRQFKKISDDSVHTIETKSIFTLLLVRNFVSHHFSFTEQITTQQQKKTFVDFYDEMLSNLLVSILFLDYLQAI